MFLKHGQTGYGWTKWTSITIFVIEIMFLFNIFVNNFIMVLSFRYNSFQIEDNMHMFSIHSICFKYNRQNIYYIDDLVQNCSNSVASALELLESCTEPLIYLPPSHFRNLCLMF